MHKYSLNATRKTPKKTCPKQLPITLALSSNLPLFSHLLTTTQALSYHIKGPQSYFHSSPSSPATSDESLCTLWLVIQALALWVEPVTWCSDISYVLVRYLFCCSHVYIHLIRNTMTFESHHAALPWSNTFECSKISDVRTH